ncbi:hypothetical protein GCK32_019611 [Trichostrongylus colubriformis]|uniref:Uncharacterized protein n=1 Tax=Trichostrongylus colubriformis TaxID=6319 RepID=A0AAN8FXK8_TRICO
MALYNRIQTASGLSWGFRLLSVQVGYKTNVEGRQQLEGWSSACIVDEQSLPYHRNDKKELKRLKWESRSVFNLFIG